MKKIIICTLKTWNITAAKLLKKDLNHGNQIYIITEQDKLLSGAREINPDYIFFPHWSYIIPEEIYENYNCIVFHMTDLPFGRGGSPLQNLIIRGYKSTKISAIKVIKELDAGPVYMKEALDLSGNASEIFERATKIIFNKMIPNIIETSPVPYEQSGEVVIFKRRKPEESRLSENMSLSNIYDYIRMLDAEGYPNAFIQFGQYHLSLSNAEYRDGKLTACIEFLEERI